MTRLLHGTQVLPVLPEPWDEWDAGLLNEEEQVRRTDMKVKESLKGIRRKNIQGDLRTTLLSLGLDREQIIFEHTGHLKAQQAEMQEHVAKRSPLSLFIKRRAK